MTAADRLFTGTGARRVLARKWKKARTASWRAWADAELAGSGVSPGAAPGARCASPQPIASWSDTTLKFTVNQGDFSDLANKYVFLLQGVPEAVVGSPKPLH